MIINFWLKLLVKGLGLGATAYILVCMALWFWQKRLIFFPSRILTYSPANLGLTYEDVWIPVRPSNGKPEKIHGWWIPSDAASNEVLLYLHGNGSNISANLGAVEKLHSLGFSVLMIDYRGYGQSEGSFPSESEVYRDSQAAWDYLVLNRQIKPENIFIFGHSLGGAIAIDLAARKPNAAGVIVESTFTSMEDLVNNQGIYRLLPAKLLLNQRFDSLSKLKILKVPILLIHGSQDRTVPPVMSQILYNQVNVPKQILFIPLAGHNNVSSVGGEDYLRAVDKFRFLVRGKQRQLVQR